MKRYSLIILLLAMMKSGYIYTQSLTEIQRDSIVNKIVRGNACSEKLILADSVISEGESVIYRQGNVIRGQNVVVAKYEKQFTIFKDNEIKFEELLSNEKQITKKYKRKQFGWLIKGLAIGVVAGVILK